MTKEAQNAVDELVRKKKDAADRMAFAIKRRKAKDADAQIAVGGLIGKKAEAVAIDAADIKEPAQPIGTAEATDQIKGFELIQFSTNAENATVDCREKMESYAKELWQFSYETLKRAPAFMSLDPVAETIVVSTFTSEDSKKLVVALRESPDFVFKYSGAKQTDQIFCKDADKPYEIRVREQGVADFMQGLA